MGLFFWFIYCHLLSSVSFLSMRKNLSKRIYKFKIDIIILF